LRVLWFREGYKYTNFFYRVANSNRRNNSIESLMVNRTISTNPSEIRDHIVQNYSSWYTEQFGWQPKLDGLTFDSIGEVEANWLERVFEEGEVFDVVKALNCDEALGPNGFSMAFFQACCDVLKDDIMKVFSMLEASLKELLMPFLSLLF
jgi:hypothetical protein